MEPVEQKAIVDPEFLWDPGYFFTDMFLLGEEGENLPLMWAVFRDGIQCYLQGPGQAAGPEDIESDRMEQEWVADNDYLWPFSFVRLCEQFNIQACTVREMLYRYRNPIQQNFSRAA